MKGLPTEDAQDVAQNILLELLQQWEKVETATHSKTYINELITWRIKDFLRKRKFPHRVNDFISETTKPLDDEQFPAWEHYSSFDDLSNEESIWDTITAKNNLSKETPEKVVETNLLFQAVMDCLSEQDMKIFLLHSEHFTSEEIADRLGISPPAVRARLHRARMKIIKKFQNLNTERNI